MGANTTSYKRAGAYVTDPVLNETTGQFSANYTPGISERRAGVSTFLHSGLKNADARTTDGSAVTADRQYDAFGNLTGGNGTWNGPFGYAGGYGYQEDGESGLKLLGHRYYDSTTGRFLSKDPIGDGRNWYSYCENNPLGSVDDGGLKPRLIIIKGDVSGKGGTVALWWYMFYQVVNAAYGSDYEIVTVVSPTTERAIEAISDADAFIYYGHGSSGMLDLQGDPHKGGKKGSKKGGKKKSEVQDTLQTTDLQEVARRRKKKGKGPLHFAAIMGCNTCQDEKFVSAWQAIARVVFGYEEDAVITTGPGGLIPKRIGRPKPYPGRF